MALLVSQNVWFTVLGDGVSDEITIDLTAAYVGFEEPSGDDRRPHPPLHRIRDLVNVVSLTDPVVTAVDGSLVTLDTFDAPLSSGETRVVRLRLDFVPWPAEEA